MSWIACGSAAVSAVSKLMGDSAENEALRKQQMARIAVFKNKEVLADFAIRNNNQRAGEIAAELAGETAEAGREVVVEERKAIGKETIRRGEGLTAGSSVVRSIDDVIAKGNQAKAQVQAKSESQFKQLMTQARDTNARELAAVDDAYQATVAGIDADQSQKKSGSEMLLGAVMAGAQGYLSGANLGASLKGAGSPFTIPTKRIAADDGFLY